MNHIENLRTILYVYIYTSTYIHTYIHTYEHTYIHTYICAYIYISIYIYSCTYRHTHTYIYIYMEIDLNIDIHIHTHFICFLGVISGLKYTIRLPFNKNNHQMTEIRTTSWAPWHLATWPIYPAWRLGCPVTLVINTWNYLFTPISINSVNGIVKNTLLNS